MTGSLDAVRRTVTRRSCTAGAQRAGLKGQDAADLVQDVFELLVRKLPSFEHDRRGSFRRAAHRDVEQMA